MPTFNNDRAIFLQMADRLCEEILVGNYQEDERVPSVRDYAIAMQVNVNTAVKCYEHLGRLGIIYNKRGMGYLVSPGAKEAVLNERRQDFIDHVLPEIFRQMDMLGIDLSLVNQLYQKKDAKE